MPPILSLGAGWDRKNVRVLNGERFGWIVVGLITAVLTLAAGSILALDYWGARRVADCRKGEDAGKRFVEPVFLRW